MSDKYKWSNETPTEPGYYMCLYFNREKNCELYKAIYWRDGWCKWNPKTEINEEQVKYFLPDSRNDFYVPCTIWCQENNENIEKL